MHSKKQPLEISLFQPKKCPFCLEKYTYYCTKCFFALYNYYLSQKIVNYDLVQCKLLCSTIKQLFMDNDTNFGTDLYHLIAQQYHILISKKGTVAKIETNDTPRSARKVPSSHSVKSKKSSNFLAALVRKTRRKRKPSPGHSLDLIRSDSSFIKGAENEIELRCQNYEKNDSFEEHNMASTSKGSDHSLSSPKRKNNFLKTLLKKQSRENIRKTSDHNLSSVHSGPESDCEKYSDNEKSPIINIPSSYIIFSKPNLSPPLATGLQMVQDINNNLKDSENNLIEMIMKHVSDSKFQRELLNSFSYHSKLQMETERRASALANDMWVQQVEIGKAQERTLQETLNSLVKQNRQLQIDHESIYRKYERLLKKFMSCAETGAKPRTSDLESHLDHVIKNSEKLRSKLDVYLRQNENLEGELHLVQNQNVCLEKQLRNCSAQMQTLKNCVNKLKTDHELEKLATNTKLQIKENIIKEIVEAGDMFLEDFSSLKKQFKEMHINFNWSKFKVKKESIPDLINMGKTFINEISKELMSIYTQIIMKNKELEDIRQANSKLQENLQKSSNELQNLSKKFDEVKSSESSRMVALQEKCRTYEKEICDVKEKCDKEKSELIKKITDKEKETVDAECSSTMLEQSKKFISSLSAENFALKSQIDTLNKLLMENGAGDVERKLQNSNEQLEFYHSKYLEFFDENQKLLIQLEAISRENIRFREQYDEDIVKTRKQLREFEDIVQENKKLKQKVDKQHLTLQSFGQKHFFKLNIYF